MKPCKPASVLQDTLIRCNSEADGKCFMKNTSPDGRRYTKLCVFLASLLFGGAYFFRKGDCMTKTNKTKMYVSIGVFSAIAFVLQVIGSMMNLTVGGFLEIEISDLPALIMALAFGPVAGIFTELVKNLLHCTMTSTGFVGELANFVINGTLCAVAGLFYKRNKTRKGAVIALLFATLAMAVAGILANLFIMLPLYMPTAPFHVKWNLVLFTILPFNVVRGLALSLITFVIYKKISPIIK